MIDKYASAPIVKSQGVTPLRVPHPNGDGQEALADGPHLKRISKTLNYNKLL